LEAPSQWVCARFAIPIALTLGVATVMGCASQVTRNTPTLRRSSLKQLPQSITRTLEARGCTIPQVAELGVGGPTEMNVIRGEFARIGQLDWAVLCSRDGRSTILVFWARPISCPGEIRDPYKDKYPPGAGVEWSDDRYINAVAERDLRGWSGPPEPGAMTHQGIADAMDSKDATVYYCSEGQWRIVATAGS
jgi:hypothetical protein